MLFHQEKKHTFGITDVLEGRSKQSNSNIRKVNLHFNKLEFVKCRGKMVHSHIFLTPSLKCSASPATCISRVLRGQTLKRSKTRSSELHPSILPVLPGHSTALQTPPLISQLCTIVSMQIPALPFRPTCMQQASSLQTPEEHQTGMTCGGENSSLQ